jgi:hypothetical protein
LPSPAYCISFLLLIPIFAAIYAIVLPSHFYHSPVQYEGALDEEAQEILDPLRTTIIANFEEVYGTPELTDDWSTININDVRLSRLRSEAREEGTILWFTLTAPMTIFNDDSSGHLELHVKTDIGLQVDEQLATVHPDGQPKVILKELLIDPHGIEDVIFPYQHHLLAVEKRIVIEGWQPNLLAIPGTLDGELTRF